MKKLSFFGVVFFAFQTMVLAQTDLEVAIGTGIWWQNGNIQYVDKPYSPQVNIGVYAKQNIFNENFVVKTGLSYSYLFSTDEYKFDGTQGVLYSLEGYEFEDLNSHYSSGFHNISIPVLFYYSKYRLQPFTGINYNYLLSGLQTSASGTNYVSDSHNFGLNIGVGYEINDRFLINLGFRHNITSDFMVETAQEGFEQELQYMKNNQINFSLIYQINKRE